MDERIIRVSPEDPKQISRFLKEELPNCLATLECGGIIVFPTETLYGLGVDIYNERAISKIIELKGRPESMPIAVGVSSLSQALDVADISGLTLEIINNCLPKPITFLTPVKKNISRQLTSGSSLIGLRFPDNPITQAVIEQFGPITATSANLHNTINPNAIEPIISQFGSKVDLYIDTGPCKLGKPSTVIDTTGDTIKIIRDGACSGEELDGCLKKFRRS
jgi:L-threonylcarbamoyladenylate synthase